MSSPFSHEQLHSGLTPRFQTHHELSPEGFSTDTTQGLLDLKGVAACDLARHWPLKPHGREVHKNDLFLRSRRVKRLDMFISHSWSAAPYLKYGCFSLRYNSVQAFTLAGLCGWAMTLYELPVPVIFVGMWLALFSGYLLGGFLCWDRTMVFFDQFCIHQDDEAKKLEGIKHIGDYLQRSQKLVIFWSADYNERLWCIFELACFLRTDSSRNVEIWPLLIIENRVRIMSFQQLYWALRTALDGDVFLPGWLIDLVFSLCTGYFCLYIDGKPRMKLQQDLLRFDARALKCYLEGDRVMIMQHIERLYGDFENFRSQATKLFAHLFNQWGANEYSLRITLVNAFPMICATMLTGRIVTGITVTAMRIILHILFYCVYGSAAMLGCCSSFARRMCRIICLCLSVVHSVTLTAVWNFEGGLVTRPGPWVCLTSVAVQVVVILCLKKVLLALTQRPHKYVDRMCEWLCPPE
ncbi:hypothetical protein FOL46_008487 [Perkinsus olseni]|uniref:Uncharacterized protein n=1 Tax=Perkinsus olseni TaxID=32597 RepID=A0A7J6L6N8_PEROL|nr:hypothetical protein FOL46_008487 [Perkinsus olseni]